MTRPVLGTTRDVLAALLATVLLVLAGAPLTTAGTGVGTSAQVVTAGAVADVSPHDDGVLVRQATLTAAQRTPGAHRHQLGAGANVLPSSTSAAARVQGGRVMADLGADPAPAPAGGTDSRAPPA